MKVVSVLLFCAFPCSWAFYLTDESRALLKNERKLDMDILDEYKKNGFPDHEFFSNSKMSRGGNVSMIVDHHFTHDTHEEKQHIEFLNHMAHGLVDILEKRSGPLKVYLNRLNFSRIAAKKYKQDWDHSKEFTAHCKTKVYVALNYIIGRHDMTHIKDCISQGVLRMAKEPKLYLDQLFEAIERNGMCPLDSPVPQCEVKDNYSITDDLGDYARLFENATALGLIPLQKIAAEKTMSIECIDAKLNPLHIKYDTFQTCTAQEKK